MTEFESEEQPLREEDIDDWEVVPGDRSPENKVSVLSVRFTGLEMRGIRDEAKRSGVSMGEVVRRAVKHFLLGASIGNVVITRSSAEANLLGWPGLPTFGHGMQSDIWDQDAARA